MNKNTLTVNLRDDGSGNGVHKILFVHNAGDHGRLLSSLHSYGINPVFVENHWLDEGDLYSEHTSLVAENTELMVSAEELLRQFETKKQELAQVQAQLRVVSDAKAALENQLAQAIDDNAALRAQIEQLTAPPSTPSGDA